MRRLHVLKLQLIKYCKVACLWYISYEESHFKTSTYSKKTLNHLGTLHPSVKTPQSQNQVIQPTHQSMHQTPVMDHQHPNTSHNSSTPKPSTLTASPLKPHSQTKLALPILNNGKRLVIIHRDNIHKMKDCRLYKVCAPWSDSGRLSPNTHQILCSD